MYKAKLIVDLPSVEANRSMGPLEWLRSLFGAKFDLRSGTEEVTVGALSLAEGLVQAFGKAGVTDVISFLVDKRVVYLDSNEVANDLPLILEAAQRTGLLAMPFKEMHLVLAHRTATMHTLFDCAITGKVALGEAEMTVALSSRLVDLQIRKGESAQAYAERIKAFAAEPDSFDPGRRELDDLGARVCEALSASLVGAKVRREPASIEVIRPGARQIAKFRALKFGDSVSTPVYRAVPTTQRSGAYIDPFYCHYHDPYYDYMSYMLVDSMMHHQAWHSAHVSVVEPEGGHLFTGAHVPADDSWIGRDAITFDSAGDAIVNDSVTRNHDHSTWSSSDSPSWLDHSSSSCSSSDSSSSCSSSSCSSSSSCGSSCSSSSCGSSCSSCGGD